ncbi:hypothetical protein ARMGADRAFT_1012777 [Armillaria gallica]|uniref:Uncharacterized protein n=1 Tax=Armillaria gallica TaxID=47427 RepID=A0A2H3DCZ0_ARMGA|nr:hypothetical protein ARMGADRAFT_1012777 [Armillaria gallica]
MYHGSSSQEQDNDATLDATTSSTPTSTRSLQPYPPAKESVDGMLILLRPRQRLWNLQRQPSKRRMKSGVLKGSSGR